MPLPSSLAPLREPEYRYFIIARFFYIMALRMVGTVVAYRLFQLTGSSLAIGLVGLSEFVPVFSLALYAGHVIDLSDKRAMLVRSIFSYSFCVVGLLAVTAPQWQDVFTPRVQELLFYSLIFMTGVIRAFAGPTTHAIIAQLVPRPVLHLAANLSSTTWLSASILGHASAGFLIAGMGVHGTFYVILAYVLLAGCITLLIKPKPPQAVRPKTGAWASVREGLQYVFHNKILLGALSLDLFAVLFGGAVALIPEFAERILEVGPIGFGWLNAAVDIGSMIMVVCITFLPLRRQQGRILLFAVGGFGLCIILFGLSRIYLLSFLALLLAGMLDGISVVVRSTILQLTTPDNIRGRVSSVNSLFVNSSNELGQFESGITARLFGAPLAVVFGGCMTLLVVLVTWWRAPELRKFEY